MKKLGIKKETKNVWERRVPLNPQAVKELIKNGFEVVVQPSETRIYKDEEFKKLCKTNNKEARDYTFKSLQKMGFKPIPSNTSFMIFPIDMDPKSYLGEMQDKGVAVRSWVFDNKNWCRVSIGTKDEMMAFISALQEVHKT